MPKFELIAGRLLLRLWPTPAATKTATAVAMGEAFLRFIEDLAAGGLSPEEVLMAALVARSDSPSSPAAAPPQVKLADLHKPFGYVIYFPNKDTYFISISAEGVRYGQRWKATIFPEPPNKMLEALQGYHVDAEIIGLV